MAWHARKALVRDPEPYKSRYFAVTAMFGAATLMPANLVLYALYPDWSLMYLANPAHLSPVLLVPFLAVHFVGGPLAGFFVVQRLLGHPDPWRLKTVFYGVGFAFLVALIAGSGRVFTVAYYDAFHAGQEGLSLFRSALFLPLMLTWGVVASVFVYAVMHVRRHVELGLGVPQAALPPVRSAP